MFWGVLDDELMRVLPLAESQSIKNLIEGDRKEWMIAI
jgi:hypothetical protein